MEKVPAADPAMPSKRREIVTYAVVAGGNLLTVPLGVVSHVLLGLHFGANAQTDAYFMSLLLASLCERFVLLPHSGVLTVAFLERHRQSPVEAWRGLWAIYAFGALAAAPVVLLGVVFADQFVAIAAPGFDDGRATLTANLLRLSLPATILTSLSSGVLGGALMALHHRVPVVLLTLVSPVVVVGGLLFAGGRYGIGWLPILALVGSVITTLGYLGVTMRASAWVLPTLDHRNALLRHVLRGSASLWLRNPSALLGLLAYRAAGSFLPQSAFSAVNYAERIANSLSLVLTTPLERVALPGLSDATVSSDRSVLSAKLRSQARLFSLVALPALLFVELYAGNIVGTLYGYGRFAADGGLRSTVTALVCMVPAIYLTGLFNLLVNAEYALKRHRPLLLRFVAVDVFRAVAFIALTWQFGLVGLVSGKIILSAWGIWLLATDLRPHLGPIRPILLDGQTVRYAVGLLLLLAIDAVLSGSTTSIGLEHRVLGLVAGGAIWLAGSLLVAHRLRIPEGIWIVERLLAKLR